MFEGEGTQIKRRPPRPELAAMPGRYSLGRRYCLAQHNPLSDTVLKRIGRRDGAAYIRCSCGLMVSTVLGP